MVRLDPFGGLRAEDRGLDMGSDAAEIIEDRDAWVAGRVADGAKLCLEDMIRSLGAFVAAVPGVAAREEVALEVAVDVVGLVPNRDGCC